MFHVVRFALYQALEEAFSVHARCDSVHPTPLCLDTVCTIVKTVNH